MRFFCIRRRFDAVKRKRIVVVSFLAVLAMSCRVSTGVAETPAWKTGILNGQVRAFCVDFNWGPGSPNAFAKPGLWPSDLIAMERNVPPGSGHQKWREIEGERYYLPGEVCDPIGKDWFWVSGDKPRPDEALRKQFEACRAGGANLLLSVPPDRHGLIPDDTIAALTRLRKNVNI